jgi:hypothetical protein
MAADPKAVSFSCCTEHSELLQRYLGHVQVLCAGRANEITQLKTSNVLPGNSSTTQAATPDVA